MIENSLSHYDLYVKCGRHVYRWQQNNGEQPVVSLIMAADPEAPPLTHQQVIQNLVDGKIMRLKEL